MFVIPLWTCSLRQGTACSVSERSVGTDAIGALDSMDEGQSIYT